MWVASDDPDKWRYRSRGVVLGRLHQMKREMWEYAINNCPNWGLDEPDADLLAFMQG